MDGKDTTFSKKQELVLNNPFTIHNNNPKWPDGLASYSLGVKHQRTTEIFGKDILIVLFPGMLNWCVAYVRDETDITSDFALAANHGLFDGEEGSLIRYSKSTSDTPESYILHEIGNKVVEWRPVSIGLRLYCANTDRQNEGWIECVRLPHQQLLEKFSLYCNPTLPVGLSEATQDLPRPPPHREVPYVQGFLGLSHAHVVSLMSEYAANTPSYTLSSHASYATMPIKDVSDYQFQLNPNKHYNEFNTIRNFHLNDDQQLSHRWSRVYYDETLGYYVNYLDYINTEYFHHFHDRLDNQYLPEHGTIFGQDFSSDAFDVILLRVHGEKHTRLVLHTAAGYEYLVTNEVDHGVTVTYADDYLVRKYIERRCAFHKLPFDSKALHPDTKY